MVMLKTRSIFSLLFALLCLSTSVADTNLLVWHKAADRADADIHGVALRPLLEDIARQTGWHIFVEPGAARNASTKFKDLPADDALRMLLGKWKIVRELSVAHFFTSFQFHHLRSSGLGCFSEAKYIAQRKV